MVTIPFEYRQLPTAEDLPDSDETPVDNELQNDIPNMLLNLLRSIWSDRQDWFWDVDMCYYYEANIEEPKKSKAIVPDGFLAIGIISMIVVSKPTEIGYTTYYSGLIHVLLYIFTFSRLLFLKALILSSLIAIGYGLAATCFQNLTSSPENASLFINNLLFLIICCVVGSISCDLMEKNARAEFNTRYGIALKSKELLVYAETYKPSPQEFLDMINEIRHNPEQLKKFLEQNLKRS